MPRSKSPAAEARKASTHDHIASAPRTGGPISDAAAWQTARTFEVGSCGRDKTGEEARIFAYPPWADRFVQLVNLARPAFDWRGTSSGNLKMEHARTCPGSVPGGVSYTISAMYSPLSKSCANCTEESSSQPIRSRQVPMLDSGLHPMPCSLKTPRKVTLESVITSGSASNASGVYLHMPHHPSRRFQDPRGKRRHPSSSKTPTAFVQAPP